VDLRLFVALVPPDPVRRELVARQSDLRRRAGPGADGLRFTPADRLHVTLRFLGAVPEERVPAIGEALAAAAARSRPLRLEVAGAGGFPNARRPRVVWVGLRDDEGALAALAADLGHRLEPLGHPAEERPLVPHFTLGRSRTARGAPGMGEALAGASSSAPVPWLATEVCLFRSHLGAAGARHEILARFPLGAAGGDEGPK
jgi:RNA 2',3'-cyclic 3'-phosphodiesterase